MKYQIQPYHRPIITDRILLFDAHFSTITSLEELCAEFYEGRELSITRRKMQSHGWTLSVVELLDGVWDEVWDT